MVLLLVINSVVLFIFLLFDCGWVSVFVAWVCCNCWLVACGFSVLGWVLVCLVVVVLWLLGEFGIWFGVGVVGCLGLVTGIVTLIAVLFICICRFLGCLFGLLWLFDLVL